MKHFSAQQDYILRSMKYLKYNTQYLRTNLLLTISMTKWETAKVRVDISKLSLSLVTFKIIKIKDIWDEKVSIIHGQETLIQISSDNDVLHLFQLSWKKRISIYYLLLKLVTVLICKKSIQAWRCYRTGT